MVVVLLYLFPKESCQANPKYSYKDVKLMMMSTFIVQKIGKIDMKDITLQAHYTRD